MFDEITKKLLAKLVLIKPTEFLLCGNDLKWNDLSKDDQKTLQALIIDTMDVIEFKDFNQGYYNTGWFNSKISSHINLLIFNKATSKQN